MDRTPLVPLKTGTAHIGDLSDVDMAAPGKPYAI